MVPPVPIPNTEVKRLSADDTALATEWENRPLPGVFFSISNKVCITGDNNGKQC